jgi:hypothetical protein
VTSFQAVTLEQVVAALGDAGADHLATALYARYLDFAPVHSLLTETFNR